jgi:DNA-binding helix-hairpin-helix protein with protein kinase domain
VRVRCRQAVAETIATADTVNKRALARKVIIEKRKEQAEQQLLLQEKEEEEKRALQARLNEEAEERRKAAERCGLSEMPPAVASRAASTGSGSGFCLRGRARALASAIGDTATGPVQRFRLIGRRECARV